MGNNRSTPHEYIDRSRCTSHRIDKINVAALCPNAFHVSFFPHPFSLPPSSSPQMTSSPFAFSSDSEHRPGSDPLLFASQSPLLQTQDFRPSHSDMGSSQANNFFSATGNPMGSHSRGSLGLYPGPSMVCLRALTKLSDLTTSKAFGSLLLFPGRTVVRLLCELSHEEIGAR